MIGVVASHADYPVVSEFFELLKTPWEILRSGRRYDVVLCSGDPAFHPAPDIAKVVLLYSGRALASDAANGITILTRGSNNVLLRNEARIPIHGAYVTFEGGPNAALLTAEPSGQAVVCRRTTENQLIVRVGYDIFHEIRTLLEIGQPIEYAHIPALELHIALLRDFILAAGVSLIEVPPVPVGYPFVACLTHDLDHPAIRLHRWDHTILGFLYRATVGSMRNFIRGAMPFRDLWSNWTAALKLPFVYSGLSQDFWRDFGKRYRNIEQELRSTYFVIPYGNYPGIKDGGSAPRYRAAGYAASDIVDTIRELVGDGCEVGLHGIDAWADSTSGRRELEEVERTTGVPVTGTRMHWLYFDEKSPAKLEEAGAGYDSTMGYRETVGFRAGTTQAYKPAGARELLELPLHAMDTALFYPGYLRLSQKEATVRIRQLADAAEKFGGCLTINWHDRSLAPERLWYHSYRVAVDDLRQRGAWFATGREATAWFRKRRAIVFEEDPATGATTARVTGSHESGLPGLRLRTYCGHLRGRRPEEDETAYFDHAIREQTDSEFENRKSLQTSARMHDAVLSRSC